MTHDELNEEFNKLKLSVGTINDRTYSNIRRIEKLEAQLDAINSIAISTAVMAEKQQVMCDDIKELSSAMSHVIPILEQQKTIKKDLEKVTNDVEEIKSKPSKRWEEVIKTIITVVVSLLFGFLIREFGG